MSDNLHRNSTLFDVEFSCKLSDKSVKKKTFLKLLTCMAHFIDNFVIVLAEFFKKYHFVSGCIEPFTAGGGILKVGGL